MSLLVFLVSLSVHAEAPDAALPRALYYCEATGLDGGKSVTVRAGGDVNPEGASDSALRMCEAHLKACQISNCWKEPTDLGAEE